MMGRPQNTLCFFLIAVLAFTAALAGEGTISVDSQVDKSTITIGDLVTYTVTVTHSQDLQVKMPELGENLGMFEIRDYSVHDPVTKDGLVQQRIDYVISTFDVGEFEIPPLTFYYSSAGDTLQHALKTKSLKIVVESMKPSEAGDIRDVKNPLLLPRDFTRYIIWGGVVLLVLLCAGGLYFWHRRRSGKLIFPQKTEPQRPPHEIALEALQELRKSDLLANGEVKAYYIAVSEIIRRYIEGRYFITALELTTPELIENLRQAEFSEEEIDLIADFLEKCDLVKFAKYVPEADQNTAILEQAFEIVQRTKLVYDQQKAEDTDQEQAAEQAVENPEIEQDLKSS